MRKNKYRKTIGKNGESHHQIVNITILLPFDNWHHVDSVFVLSEINKYTPLIIATISGLFNEKIDRRVKIKIKQNKVKQKEISWQVTIKVLKFNNNSFVINGPPANY